MPPNTCKPPYVKIGNRCVLLPSTKIYNRSTGPIFTLHTPKPPPGRPPTSRGISRRYLFNLPPPPPPPPPEVIEMRADTPSSIATLPDDSPVWISTTTLAERNEAGYRAAVDVDAPSAVDDPGLRLEMPPPRKAPGTFHPFGGIQSYSRYSE